MGKIAIAAFDLDGTLTQHKTPLSHEARSTLDMLKTQFHLVMVGAGNCMRIFNQLEHYPIDIVGNYGIQIGKFNSNDGSLSVTSAGPFYPDKESIILRAQVIREKYGLTEFSGDSIEFHDSGVITFALLGTKAAQCDKLKFDPDRKFRRSFYQEVASAFSEYNVFIGGSSSFDMAPKPYDKFYALNAYCKELGVPHSDVFYFGDDYGIGGNDESVFKSDFNFIKVDNYLDFPELARTIMK